MGTQLWHTLKLEGPLSTGIAHLFLHRPSHHNALDSVLFRELPLALSALDANPSVRVIILSGSGKHFCSGIELGTLSSHLGDAPDGVEQLPSDVGRKSEKLVRSVKQMQAAISAVEECRKPVIAAVHGACIGAGVDLLTACDLRYCSQDCFFSVKEVDLAIVPDLGTLQRLPRLIGHGNAMELALTGRRFDGEEAKRLGLVQDVLPSIEMLRDKVEIVAGLIAAKSPLAVVGIKRVLLKARDVSVAHGLDDVATWNASMIMSHDVKEAIQAQKQKRKPVFAKL
eukprot:c14572_g1_i1 orf=168-1016(+)